MLRAVLDANVLVSGTIRRNGPSGWILQALEERRAFELILSSGILREFERVLFYPRIRKELLVTDDEIRGRVFTLKTLADLQEGELEIKAVPGDPDDDKYIAEALLGRADFIVSGDRHLLDLMEFQGVAIVTPRKFLEILTGDQPLLRVRRPRRRAVRA